MTECITEDPLPHHCLQNPIRTSRVDAAEECYCSWRSIVNLARVVWSMIRIHDRDLRVSAVWWWQPVYATDCWIQGTSRVKNCALCRHISVRCRHRFFDCRSRCVCYIVRLLNLTVLLLFSGGCVFWAKESNFHLATAHWTRAWRPGNCIINHSAERNTP